MARASQQTVNAPPAARRAGRSTGWAEIWAYRSILWLLTRRDLKARYAGSMLGVMWNVINPIVMIVIYILILGTILHEKWGEGSGRGAYTVHLCAGMIPWLVFQEVLTRCSSAILDNASLIKKVAFPEVILHITVLLNAVFIHAISYAAFILIMLGLGRWPGEQVFLCFGILLAIALFALGLGLVVSVLNIYFRDVGQVVFIGLQFLFWFTPIVYPISMLKNGSPGRLVSLLLRLMECNPVMHFTRLSQWAFGDSPQDAFFSWLSLAVVTLGPLAALAVGLTVFNHFKHDMLDNI